MQRINALLLILLILTSRHLVFHLFFLFYFCLLSVFKHADWEAWSQTQSSWDGHTVGAKVSMTELGKHSWIRAEWWLLLAWHSLFRKESISSQIQPKRFYCPPFFFFIFHRRTHTRLDIFHDYNSICLDQRFHRHLVDCSRWRLIDVVAVLVETTSHMEEL